MVTICSTRFGTLEVRNEMTINFPIGLIGLPGAHYALLEARDGSRFGWLHSVDHPDIALPVTNPHRSFDEFRLAVSDDDLDRVGTRDLSAADVYVTVRIDDRRDEFVANLRAPIVIYGGRGHQVINHARSASLQAVVPRPSTPALWRGRGVPSAATVFQGGNPCSSSPGAQARRSSSATTSSSR